MLEYPAMPKVPSSAPLEVKRTMSHEVLVSSPGLPARLSTTIRSELSMVHAVAAVGRFQGAVVTPSQPNDVSTVPFILRRPTMSPPSWR